MQPCSGLPFEKRTSGASMTQTIDILVLGGGPAGSAAAKRAADLGLSVAIIDKAVFPRDKLCGGMLSGRSIRALEALFAGQSSVPKALVSRDILFRWAGAEVAEFQAPHDLTLTMRYDFDAELQRHAVEKGAKTFYGARDIALDPDKNQIRIDGQTLNYRVLIGADGANSQVARTLFGRAMNPKTIGFGLEVEVPHASLEKPPHVQIDFRAVNWGYGWVFPKSSGWTIGVGGLLCRNPDMKSRMADYLTSVGVDPGSAKVKGHHLPFGDYRKIPGRKNVLLAGDAAGLVDPLTGEGIAYALESGALAVEAAKTALDHGKPEHAIRHYRKALQPQFSELANAVFLRRLAFLPRLEGLFRDRLTHSDRLRTAFFDLLDGQESYDSLKRQARSKTLKALSTGFWRR